MEAVKNKTPVPHSRYMTKYKGLLKLREKSIFESQNNQNAKYATISF